MAVAWNCFVLALHVALACPGKVAGSSGLKTQNVLRRSKYSLKDYGTQAKFPPARYSLEPT